MNKYIIFLSLIILTVVISACVSTPEQAVEPNIHTTVIEENQQDEDDNTTASSQVPVYSAVNNGSLTEEEAVGLVYIREEEKLAHDVYLTLFEQWGLPIFQNIAASEQTHTEAIKTLLNKYEIPDPVDGNLLGQFSNQNLQALYDDLISTGSVSLADALIVGTAVEEIDILDLEKELDQTELVDIIQVYENLLSGSKNHLRSFVATFEKQAGQVFQPQYLSPTLYEGIISGSFENGRGSGQTGGKRFGNSTSTLNN